MIISSHIIEFSIFLSFFNIYKLKVSLPVKAGDVLLADRNGEGIDVVATRTLG
jgi:CxxC motif-containing protein